MFYIGMIKKAVQNRRDDLGSDGRGSTQFHANGEEHRHDGATKLFIS